MSDLVEEMTSVRQQWEELKPKIDEVVAKGQNTLHLAYGIGPSLANYLKKAGYTVETDRGDYQSCGYTIISW